MKPKRKRDSRRPSKLVGSTAAENPDTMSPVFAFDKMQKGTGFSVDCCDDENRSAALKRIFLLSQMTWNEIKNAPKHGLGTEKIAQSAIKAAMPPSVTEEVTLLALRYKGRAPMVGYRDGRNFHVLFFDAKYCLYDH